MGRLLAGATRGYTYRVVLLRKNHKFCTPASQNLMARLRARQPAWRFGSLSNLRHPWPAARLGVMVSQSRSRAARNARRDAT
jgi:hypothetical protein